MIIKCFGNQLFSNKHNVSQKNIVIVERVTITSKNDLPIALGEVIKDLENIDLITPNRLLLARNNNRCPVGQLSVTEDVGKMIQRNNDVFSVWFRAWLTSYVPTLVMQPKWFRSDKDLKKGDIVLFLKSDKEFDKQHQFGTISDIKKAVTLKLDKLKLSIKIIARK